MFKCEWCGKEFKCKSGLSNHVTKKHIPKLEQKAWVGNITLDLTIGELNNYIKTHPKCEICGRTIEEVTKYTGPTAAKRLCIDHNHSTNQFRGLLCQVCNRQLGWFEKYYDSIISYLNKNS